MNKDSNTKNSYSHRQNSNKRVGTVESVRVGRGLVSRGSASHREQGFERRKRWGRRIFEARICKTARQLAYTQMYEEPHFEKCP